MMEYEIWDQNKHIGAFEVVCKLKKCPFWPLWILSITGVFYTLVFWAYLLIVKSNFDDLDVVRKLETRATTFISGVWGHVVEKVIEKLGFPQKSGSPEGSKIQRYGSRKMLLPRELPMGPKNYLQYPYFVLDLVPGQISNPQKYFFWL
jgi:hypothetical protein